jgi:hypothetical protein
VAITDVTFLEVSAAAYALASEECQEHFRKLVVDTLIKRVTAMNAKLITSAPPATAGFQQSSYGLSLEPIEGEVPQRVQIDDTATSIILTSGGDVVVVEDDPVSSRHMPLSFDKH